VTHNDHCYVTKQWRTQKISGEGKVLSQSCDVKNQL